jgi:hypothetical protein
MGGIGGTRVPATATFWGPEGRDGTGKVEGGREGGLRAGGRAAEDWNGGRERTRTALGGGRVGGR